ncbi:MAG TPA: tRNA (adenosine(37)-N6)-threonylcarbamoyltransferase complex dimerization subunit type 1 TsaB [Flavitalea sp.]|nr:tRNA (adenosine(37)-N6)-threonylcarbamoyltransferase complex dimerization subunit type 1 TsaB [Flavitalea sp.]
MSLILNLDTSTEKASICIASDGETIALVENHQQKDHASWIHSAISQLLQQAKYTIHDLRAVAISAGPGSYTGLRVGMATAKGICYALNIPLITENTLRVMALAIKQAWKEKNGAEKRLFCPMIDARRMEIFTALFTPDLSEEMSSTALVIEEATFANYLSKHEIIFSGNGSKKFQQLVSHPNAVFSDVQFSAQHLAVLSRQKFLDQEFSDVAYSEPLYLKEFYTVSKKSE